MWGGKSTRKGWIKHRKPKVLASPRGCVRVVEQKHLRKELPGTPIGPERKT